MNYLPKKTNDHSVSREVLRKGFCDDMDFQEKRKISLQNNHEYTKQQYEKMGIKVLTEDNDLFYAVELPEGWKIERQYHYWSDVIDNKGRVRISYFSKLTPWDKDAFSNFCKRYSYTIVPFDDYTTSTYEERKFKPWSLWITDADKRIKKLSEITPTTDDEYYESDKIFKKEAIEYLNKNYPNWEDINAYWEE